MHTNGTPLSLGDQALARAGQARAIAVEGHPDGGSPMPAVVANSASALVHAALHLAAAADRLTSALDDHARDMERTR